MYCKKCGKEILDDSEFCPICGEKQNEESKTINAEVVNAKSKLAAGLLNIFIPGIGRIYLGYIGIGVAQLLLSFIFVGAIWSFIDGILILIGTISCDGKGRPLGE